MLSSLSIYKVADKLKTNFDKYLFCEDKQYFLKIITQPPFYFHFPILKETSVSPHFKL